MLKFINVLLISIFVSISATFAMNVDREMFRREIQREKRELLVERREVNHAKRWDAKLCKVMTDIHGNRVRVEEFITRPACNQIKFTSLTRRRNRFDYMWFLQIFNGDLPSDISAIAFREYWNKDEKPALFPETQISCFSNTIDSVEYKWLQEIDKIEIYNVEGNYDYFWNLSPTDLTLTINGVLKTKVDFSDFSYTPSEPSCSKGKHNNGGRWSRENYTWSNTFFQREHYIINNDGKVQDIFFDSQENINKIVENYNIERIYTASEFDGRTIDVIFVPEILVRYLIENPILQFNQYLFIPINTN